MQLKLLQKEQTDQAQVVEEKTFIYRAQVPEVKRCVDTGLKLQRIRSSYAQRGRASKKAHTAHGSEGKRCIQLKLS